MPRPNDDFAFIGAFPPRTIAFCRAAALAILSALGTGILVLALAAFMDLQMPRPSFARAPDGAVLDSPESVLVQNPGHGDPTLVACYPFEAIATGNS